MGTCLRYNSLGIGEENRHTNVPYKSRTASTTIRRIALLDTGPGFDIPGKPSGIAGDVPCDNVLDVLVNPVVLSCPRYFYSV